MICLQYQNKTIPRAQHTSNAVYKTEILKTHYGTFRDCVELVAGHRKLMDFGMKPLLSRAKEPCQQVNRKLREYHRVGLKMAENKEINKNAGNRTLAMLTEVVSQCSELGLQFLIIVCLPTNHTIVQIQILD
jgi:hypothetical protein